jgi:hypothetical protein
MVDWDLDAPGLHCFFPSPGPSPDAQGLIDLVQRLDRKVQGASREPLDEESAAQLFEDIQLQDFVSSTDVDGVYLMAAGRFDEGYGERVSTFNWRGLFQRAPTLIRNFAEFVGSQYDYVLVDSRTGFNDISGICTSLLPDQLVLVFTPNRQSLIGGLDTVKRAARYRLQSDDIRPLSILPLPSRIDVSEPELMEKWRFGDPEKGEDERGYQIRFEEAFKEIYGLTSCDLENYFDDVQIQHVPRYSYGEKIAARRERGTRLSLSRSYATFTDILARQESPWDRLRSAQGGAELVADDSPTAVKIQAVKDYLPEERHRLKLFDLFTNEMRDALPRIKSLGLNEHPTAESFARRLRDYESIFSDLIRMQVLVGYWGEWYTRPLLGLGAKRVCDQYSAQSGLTVWLATRFYPATLLMYGSGISAVAAEKYENLKDLLLTPCADSAQGTGLESPLLSVVTREMLELRRTRAFSLLPGLERRYTPMSDYLFDFFRPIVDELVFLNSAYEHVFNRFEMLYALQYAHTFERKSKSFPYWGPVGRFGWKTEPSPLESLISEGLAHDANWPPLRAGLFGGTVQRFGEVASGFLNALRQNPLDPLA